MAVCPRVVNLKGQSCRVPVRIFNISAKVVEIKPKTTICSLSEVKVVRHEDFSSDNVSDDSNSDTDIESLGVDISDNLPQEVKGSCEV